MDGCKQNAARVVCTGLHGVLTHQQREVLLQFARGNTNATRSVITPRAGRRGLALCCKSDHCVAICLAADHTTLRFPDFQTMESGAETESTSAAAQLAECCGISLAEAASFLEATDGSIPVCWSWAALQLILLCRPPQICTSPQWLNTVRSIVVIKKNPLPKGHDSAQVSGWLLAHDPFRPPVC